ncbi:MAG: hypothetical protein MK171_02865 [Pirellulales bacterium]|nr:hypothetical protein [Pirellulales bacterium]
MKKRNLVIFYFALLLAGFLWPGMLIANRVEPFVLGLPFLMFWFVLLIVIQAVSLLLLYWAEFRRK